MKEEAHLLSRSGKGSPKIKGLLSSFAFWNGGISFFNQGRDSRNNSFAGKFPCESWRDESRNIYIVDGKDT